MKIIYFILVLFLLFTTSTGHANEPIFADGPYKEIALIVGTSFSCAVLADDKKGYDSHCFYGNALAYVGVVAGQTVLKETVKDTIVEGWVGAIAGCSVGALKEIRDHQGFGDSDYKDFLWTCLPAITANIGLNGVIKFYKEKEKTMAIVELKF